MKTLDARILFGINNIYTVKPLKSCDNSERGETLECRIKGKILGCSSGEYAPLAPGDIVSIQELEDQHHKREGLILERRNRINAFSRWNIKRRKPQNIAANVQRLYCLTSPELPPFRPRFIDRVLVAAQRDSIEAAIIVNKTDQEMTTQMKERLDDYMRIGYPVYYCSASTGEGVETLREAMKDQTVFFFGQSGVGKSTLINRIMPGIKQETGEISEKYSRGRHTTNFSILLDHSNGCRIIDTPGVRDFFLHSIEPAQLTFYFPEILKFSIQCGFNGCTHTHEPRCAVKDAYEEGHIHHDRFESYLRILDELNNS